jgi:large subunit ribosomal protein L28
MISAAKSFVPWFSRLLSTPITRTLVRPIISYLSPGSVVVSAPLNLQVRHRSNRSRRGLYDGKDIRSGNNVPFSMKTTKRKFKPNVFKKSVYSDILDKMVRFNLTTSALRSIDKAGGLDNYIMTSKHVTEGQGLRMKKRIKTELKWIAYCERKGWTIIPKAEREKNKKRVSVALPLSTPTN